MGIYQHRTMKGYHFIDWSKTSDKQAIKKSVTDKFSIDNMILEISSEYLV